MRFFKELYSVRAQIVVSRWTSGLESALILRLPVETSVARLEVGARNVRLGQFVQTRIDSPGSTEGVFKGELGVDCGVKAVVARDSDAVGRHLRLVLLALVKGRVDGTRAESILRLSKPVCVIGGLGDLVSSKLIVGLHAGPGHPLGRPCILGTLTDS